MKYIIIDTEATGIGNEFNLIQLYCGISDDEKIEDEIFINLQPDNGIFTIDPEAMRINKIDVIYQNPFPTIFFKYKQAKEILYGFLKDHYRKNNNTKLIPIGHAVDGDINLIQRTIISEGSWNNFVSLLPIDTLIISNFLRNSGKLKLLKLNLESLCNYFSIEITDLHNAKSDALATFEIFKKLKEII